jgi:membrane protease YdiL (CAAX protease family)
MTRDTRQQALGRTPLGRLEAIAIVLEILLGTGAIGGGLALMLGPNGEILPLPVAALSGSPFANYFVPGAILFTVIGLGPLGAAVLAWRRNAVAPLLAFAVGVALLVWLVVEIALVGYTSEPPLQALYLGLGAAITLLGVAWIRQKGSQRIVWDRLVQRPLLSFFVLANLFSWLAWAPLVIAGLGWTTIRFSPYLHLVGGLGPLVAAIVVTAACDGRAGLTRTLAMCIGARGRRRWGAFAVAAPVLLFAVSAAALQVAGRGEVDWANVGRSVEYPALSRGVYWLANLFFYGFGEEVGWRGFALPRLQARKSALTSALLIGVAWAAWHLPLFAFAGGLSSMGLSGVAGWLFSIFTGSILVTWIFNASRGSVLAVALFHGVLDIVMTSKVVGPLTSVMGASITLFGLAVPLIFGATNLSRGRRVQALAAARPESVTIRAL